MATITSYTAAKLAEFFGPLFKGANVNEDGDLVFTKFDNSTVNVGPAADLSDINAAVDRNLVPIGTFGGYRPTSRKCPQTKAEVSVNNTPGGGDGLAIFTNTLKASSPKILASANWTMDTLIPVAADLYFNHSGPRDSSGGIGGSLGKAMDFTLLVDGDIMVISGYHYSSVIPTEEIRIWIDDEEIEDWYLGTRASGTLQGTSIITAPGTNANYYININFAERGIYKVRVAGLTSPGYAPSPNDMILVWGNADTVFEPAPPTKSIAIISDSLYDTILANTTLNAGIEITTELGVRVFNCSQGGSGLQSPSSSGTYGDKSFGSDQVFDALHRIPVPDLFIVNGSANDLSLDVPTTYANAHALAERLATEFPGVPAVWFGIEPINFFEATYTIGAMTAFEAALKDIFDDEPNFVGTVPTMVQQWFTGTGYKGNLTGNGNQDFTIGTDSVHLTTYGTIYCGRVAAHAIREFAMGLGT